MPPSLLVLALTANVSQTLVYSQVILFGIPFALIPLLLITRDPALLGEAASSRLGTALMVTVTAFITTLNAFLIYRALGGPG